MRANEIPSHRVPTAHRFAYRNPEGKFMSRHASIADQLRPLLSWTNKPDAAAPIVADKTNWAVIPSNDNNPEDMEGLRLERRLEIIPSIKAIRDSIATNDTERNDAGQVVRIGSLRFSDGRQTERAYCYGPEGKLILFDARLPVGAMLGTKEKADAQSGAAEPPKEVGASNRYFAEMLKTSNHRYISGKRRRKTGKSYKAEESRAMLAAAWANTFWPAVSYARLPPGLPCGSAKVADSFLGMQKVSSNGNGGSIAWQDISSAMAEREMWHETILALPVKDVEVLNAAGTAKNTHAIGALGGYTGRTAWRQGKAALLSANDNLRHALRKSAA